jgi:hypothetical protein
MSKKFPKVPQGRDPGSFLVLGDSDWSAIQDKTGYKFSRAVRNLLGLATLFLTRRLAEEQSAPRRDQQILKKLESLKQQAANLRVDLFAPHLWEKDRDKRRQTLETELALELEYIMDNPPITAFDTLRFSLGAIIGSCDNVLQELKNMQEGPKDGQAYDTWIVLVSVILMSYGLEYRVSNAKDQKTPALEQKASPFVGLIEELQKRAINKYVSSKGALSKAINRARAVTNMPSKVERERVINLVHKLAGATNAEERDAHKWLVNKVLEGRFVGLHPITPQIFFDGDVIERTIDTTGSFAEATQNGTSCCEGRTTRTRKRIEGH